MPPPRSTALMPKIVTIGYTFGQLFVKTVFLSGVMVLYDKGKEQCIKKLWSFFFHSFFSNDLRIISCCMLTNK